MNCGMVGGVLRRFVSWNCRVVFTRNFPTKYFAYWFRNGYFTTMDPRVTMSSCKYIVQTIMPRKYTKVPTLY